MAAIAEIAGDDYEPEIEVDLFSLLTAFQAVDRARQAPAPGAACRAEQISVEARIEQLLGSAVRKPRPAGSRTSSPTSTIAAA